jgi:uncharacterized damage-inducible protein DinB
MHAAESLRDIHARTHRSLAGLFDHLAGLPAGSLDAEREGFAYPTVRLQLHHMLGAEEYWVGVLQGRIEISADDAFPDLASLVAYRAAVAAATGEYLGSAGPDELNTARPMVTWGGREQVLIPAAVVLRTQTHHYTHLGQILAMIRQLGHPARGLDFPLT